MCHGRHEESMPRGGGRTRASCVCASYVVWPCRAAHKARHTTKYAVWPCHVMSRHVTYHDASRRVTPRHASSCAGTWARANGAWETRIMICVIYIYIYIYIYIHIYIYIYIIDREREREIHVCLILRFIHLCICIVFTQLSLW